jgi:hypothetical protein
VTYGFDADARISSKTSWEPMSKTARRGELEALRETPEGVRRLAAMFDMDLDLVRGKSLPDVMIEALIEHLLRQEFPDWQLCA